MRNNGITVIEWNELDQEVDRLIQEIDELDPYMPYYNSFLDQKIARLEEIEAIADESIRIKTRQNRPNLRLV